MTSSARRLGLRPFVQISVLGYRPSTLEANRRPHAGSGERRAACRSRRAFATRS